MDNKLIGNEKNILFYNDEEGNTKVEVLLENEDVWLNAEALATLFNVKRPAITKHINNIYEDEELEEGSTCSKMEHMGNNGKQVFAECSIDYDKNSDTAITFYKTIQNKFHYAITGNTAAEIVYKRVDSKKENMGLTTWENSPDGKILKSDVIIAKNYLNEQEIKNLNNLVNLFLDIAENNAERSITMYMEDWKNEVENALKVFHYEVLEGKGKISHKQAVEKAENEYEKYKVIQDKNYVSDFDRLLSETKQIENK